MLLKYNLTLYHHRATLMDIKNKKENTMQPFELGDIFLGCTELIDDIDDHKGNGRILQYDKDLNLKGILWTEGTEHLVIGLKIDPKGILWAFDMHNIKSPENAFGVNFKSNNKMFRTFGP